jgi:tetratricopeptide (TPR) repeat protein
VHPSQIEEIVRRLVANPHDEPALAHAHAQGQADPRGYAMLLERVGELTTDPTYSAHWLSEAANVWSTTIGDPRRAATLLMRAIERDPASDLASDRLAGLYREKGDHRALVALFERRAKALAAVAGNDPTRVQQLSMMHEELGRMWQEPPLAQPRKAIENYRKAYELDPMAAAAIYAARELLKAQNDFKEALPLYDLEIRAVQDTDRKLALYRDEAAVRASIGDRRGATNTLRDALRLDPQDTGLIYELASSIVARILANEEVGGDERAEAAEHLVAMAQQYDGDLALAYSEAALDALPGHDRAMQLADHFARALGREETLGPRWAGYVAANPRGPLAFDGRKKLARIYEAAGRFDEALAALEPLKDDPDPSVAMRLTDLYARAGKTSELAQHMERHSAALPPAERLNKMLEIASMLASKGDKKAAMDKYREVLAADPQHPEALSFVEDVLRGSRQYKELREVLTAAARASGAPMESRKSQLREVASLSETQLKDA